ncbi:MAG: TldD/PmbA family protein [Chloroflexi bacterium]|nr:TldD/PmbA family protein [Chloroflexota bacterium]
MQDFVKRALDSSEAAGATFAEVRIEDREVQGVSVKNGVVDSLLTRSSQGIGVRVIAGGAWGFAATPNLTGPEIDRVACLAVTIARASALAKKADVELGGQPVQRGVYRTPFEVDPFSVSLDAKIELLLAADRAMRSVRGLSVAESSVGCIRVRKTYANSQGSLVEQELVETGGGIVATAVEEEEVQQRSFPNSFGRHQGTGGWELVEAMHLAEAGPRMAEQAVALLSAPHCSSDTTTVVIDPTQMALQVHESCGHAVELDRVLGWEASYAGTSFLTPDKLGIRYGSEQVSIVADGTSATGLGTYGWDDEGVAATVTPLIDRGIFVGYLSSRETAARLGNASSGAARASSWNRIPLVRMTNVNLLPGDWTLEGLIADTDRGLYLETNRSWSIDDKRLNFQFGTEIAWEITNGRLGRMVKNPTYGGITPEFWGSCDGVAREWQVWGTTNCGKGQPGQTIHVGHGAAPARFRGVRVGIA